MASPKKWVYAAIVASVVALSGCSTPKLLWKTETVVLEPPAELFVCPDAPLPPPGVIKQSDLVPLIADLYGAHATCQSSMAAIQKYIQDQKAIIQK